MTISKVLIIFLLLLSGCATKPPSILTQGPSMRDVLQQAGTGTDASYRENWQPGNWQATNNLHGYTRTAHNELEGLFPRLPNPDLCMFVVPHLSVEGATVPGYTSCFPMYEKNHYALPGEAL